MAKNASKKQIENKIVETYSKVRNELWKKTVIIIGRYDIKTIKFLNSIKSELMDLGYVPLIVEKIPNTHGETPRQKVHCLLASSKFVISDDSFPSGETLELEYCKNVGTVVGIICKDGYTSSFMTIDFIIHSPDFKTFSYRNRGFKETKRLLNSVVRWAEKRINDREKHFQKIKLKRATIEKRRKRKTIKI